MPTIEIHGASDADDQTGRAGDFIIDDTAIHCTTAPANLLIEKCRSNIEHGLIRSLSPFPIVSRRLEIFSKDAGIGGRVEVWDLQQFPIDQCVRARFFNSSTRKNVLSELIDNYNGIIDEFETDPSLHIEYDK